MERKALNILLLEDLKTDVELLKRAVLKLAPGSMFTVASSEEEFKERLTWSSYDMVIADYRLPTYNGLEALLLVRSQYPELPFIFCTGSLNDEEEVAQTILQGANGYILKRDMKQFGTRFSKALDRIEKEQQQREDRAEKERQKAIKLQKLSALLEQSADFPEKANLQSIVAELLEL